MADVKISGFAGQGDITVRDITFDRATLLLGLMDDTGYSKKPNRAALNNIVAQLREKLNFDLTIFFPESIAGTDSNKENKPQPPSGDVPIGYRRALAKGVRLGG